MRPNVLNPLFASLSALPGIGPKLEALFARLLGRDSEPPGVVDLLFHLPTGFVDRSNQPKLSAVTPGTVVTVAVTVGRHRPPPPNRPRAPYNIDTSDDTNTLTLSYFKARKDYLEKLLPEGSLRYVSGTTTLYDGNLQMVHPDRVVDADGFAKLPLLDPVYPLTEGLHPNQVRKAVDLALDRLPALPEWQDQAWLTRNAFPSFADALGRVHRPQTPEDIAPEGAAWSRLAYDELLASQVALALLRAHLRVRAGRGSAAEGRTRARIIAALPYSLTPLATARGHRHRRRPGAAAAHVAAPPWRCRLRQDRRCLARRRHRYRGRSAGRIHGADRDLGASAFCHHRAACRGGECPRRHSDRT